MSFRLTGVPGRIRRGDRLAVSGLIGGRPGTSLENVMLRIVASNMEQDRYRRGSGSSTRTVSFKEPIRSVVLYEKTVRLFPKRSSIQR